MRYFGLSLAISFSLTGLIPVGASAEQGGLEKRVAALEAILQFVRVESEPINGLRGPHLIIEGANVHVRSGSGSTNFRLCPTSDPDCVSGVGLGNLVVGYNEGFRGQARLRRGMHNLVVGPEHRYPSSGGFVAGRNNGVWGQGASVTGGAENRASGENASICGGELNVASGTSSSVGGGFVNWARGDFSSVSGGGANTASGDRSSISGGSRSEASGPDSSVSGGEGNGARGAISSVSGGRGNSASGFASSVSGGRIRTAPENFNWAAGNLFETH